MNKEYKFSKIVRLLYKLFCYSRIIACHYIYTFIFRIRLFLNGVSYGNNISCWNAIPSLQINSNSGIVRFGNNIIFNAYTDHSWNCKCKLLVKKDAILEIGDNSGMNGVMIFCSQKIIIGNNVKIGGGSRIFDTDFHSQDFMKRRHPDTDGPSAKKAPVMIGNDVFIGANCIIGKGITIGDRSMIAAGSVVVTSVPADEVWGGNPAKFLKKILH